MAPRNNGVLTSPSMSLIVIVFSVVRKKIHVCHRQNAQQPMAIHLIGEGPVSIAPLLRESTVIIST